MHVCAGGVINDAARSDGKQGVEVAGRDRLVDHKRVVPSWRRNLYPVEEHTRVLLFDHTVFHSVLHTAHGLGCPAGKLRTGRPGWRDLTHLHRRRSRCWGGRRRW